MVTSSKSGSMQTLTGGVSVGRLIYSVRKMTAQSRSMDYKCTSVWSVIHGKVEWDKQLNCYAWLAEQAGREVTGLQIVAVLVTGKGRKQSKTPTILPPDDGGCPALV